MLLLENNLFRGVLGIVFLLGVCYLLSNNKKAINWKLVGLGLFAQIMFAMGVLHTTFMGQPVFWVFFGIILCYLMLKRISRKPDPAKPLSFDKPYLLLVILWQLILIVGLIFSRPLFGEWAPFSITLSCFLLLYLLFKVGKKQVELTKWGILLSLVLLTCAVYFKLIDPQIFKLLLESTAEVFVKLINIGKRGAEFLFGNLASDQGPWAYGPMYLPYRCCLILFSLLHFLQYYIIYGCFRYLFT